MAWGSLNIVRSSTNYSFVLAGPIEVSKKPDTGEILKTIATNRRLDQIDAPMAMSNWTGIGVSRAIETMPDAENRLWEMKNCMAWPGLLCLGPQARTTTDVTGTRRTIGFLQFRNNLFAFADVAGTTSTETIQTWGTTGVWSDATAVADYNTTAGAGSGYPCVGMADQDGRAYALRTIFIVNGAARYQLIYSTDGTTWTVPDHVNAADCPGPSTTYSCVGLISINGVLYTATLNSSNQILLRQNAAGNNGVTWTTTATSKESVASITGLIIYPDYTATDRPAILTPEGVFIWDGTTFYKSIRHRGFNDSNTGQQPTHWEVESIEDGYLSYPIGKNIQLFNWGNNNGEIRYRVGPTYKTQGMPAFRDGAVTALTSTPDILFAAIGGDSSSTTGGIYMYNPSAFGIQPLGWVGPFYDIGTANRQIRAMIVSSYNDGVVRLHVAVDNGTSNDTDLLYFDNIDKDPRNVSNYLHTSSVGTIIFPKNDRFLPEVQKIFRAWQVTGTNISATNKVTDLFISVDAAPLASDGTWGTTLGEITTNAGSLNFAATPAGTGQSARSMQGRMDLEGASNASPYIEGINITMKTLWPVKYIRRFLVWASALGSMRPLNVVLDELEELISTTTDLNTTFGEEPAAIVMEPWRYGEGPISYEYEAETSGPTNDQIKAIKKVFLTLVDV